ncbi:MAG: hypothetical protein NZR01_12215 [Bryobacteraceae bacterium]|nr:hypothetical protein [Bryobacteraceae bacterium]
MQGWQSGMARAARLLLAWLVLWAGFWLSFFTMIAVLDPYSLDPGEPAAFARIFSLLGMASGIVWAVGAGFASGPGPGILRAALWGAVAAAAPVVLIGKPGQTVVLGPMGAAAGGTLAYLARAARKMPGGGTWGALLLQVSRGFGGEAARRPPGQGPGPAEAGPPDQNVP